MSTVIRVDCLSKKYLIRHENQESYTTLRDVMTNSAKAIGNKMRQPFRHNNIKNPSKEEFWALKNVSFEVKQGDRIGIIGRNGAGKSTLLKLLSRITEPTSGSIRLKGRVSSLLEVGTGFHPELTGRENVYLNGAILGMSKLEIKKKFDEIVAFAEVEQFLDTPVKRYSSGMQVRLAFAVAAHLEPEILIIDEVLAVGDIAFQKKCLGKMEEVSKGDGRTIIFVSHNIFSVKALCNKGMLLVKGENVITQGIDEVINCYLNKFQENISEDTTRGLRFVDVKHNNGYGHHIYNPFEALIVESVLKTDYCIDNAFINFVMEDSENQFIIHSRTDRCNIFPELQSGVYNIKVEIPNLFVKPGIYQVWFRLFVDNHEGKIIVDSEKIPVIIKGEPVGGLLLIPVNWGIEKESE